MIPIVPFRRVREKGGHRFFDGARGARDSGSGLTPDSRPGLHYSAPPELVVSRPSHFRLLGWPHSGALRLAARVGILRCWWHPSTALRASSFDYAQAGS
jgi:hypothetical protein